MTILEALIKGMPQRVQNAATLLALSAWYIYPDILVLGSKQTEVKMNDKLVGTGGILTVGLTYAGGWDSLGAIPCSSAPLRAPNHCFEVIGKGQL
jgi:hypothetical protein